MDIRLALSAVPILLCLVLFTVCILNATICDMYQLRERGGGGELPYISYIGMYRPKGCGFWAVLVWKWV